MSKINDLLSGAHVIDTFNDEGIVVKIIKGYSTENHGKISVWQMWTLSLFWIRRW